jgi:hypothetical protein
MARIVREKVVLSHFKWVMREEIHRNSPLTKGERTQETRCSIRGSALESAKGSEIG